MSSILIFYGFESDHSSRLRARWAWPPSSYRSMTPPPCSRLSSPKAVTSPVFDFKFASSGSELFLGGTNRALFTGDFTWVRLTNEVCYDPTVLIPASSDNSLFDQGYWHASFNSISVNGQTVLGKQKLSSTLELQRLLVTLAFGLSVGPFKTLGPRAVFIFDISVLCNSTPPISLS